MRVLEGLCLVFGHERKREERDNRSCNNDGRGIGTKWTYSAFQVGTSNRTNEGERSLKNSPMEERVHAEGYCFSRLSFSGAPLLPLAQCSAFKQD